MVQREVVEKIYKDIDESRFFAPYICEVLPSLFNISDEKTSDYIDYVMDINKLSTKEKDKLLVVGVFLLDKYPQLLNISNKEICSCISSMSDEDIMKTTDKSGNFSFDAIVKTKKISKRDDFR